MLHAVQAAVALPAPSCRLSPEAAAAFGLWQSSLQPTNPALHPALAATLVTGRGCRTARWSSRLRPLRTPTPTPHTATTWWAFLLPRRASLCPFRGAAGWQLTASHWHAAGVLRIALAATWRWLPPGASCWRAVTDRPARVSQRFHLPFARPHAPLPPAPFTPTPTPTPGS